MDKIVDIATVSDYNAYWGVENRHPLVNDILTRFEELLDDYFVSDQPKRLGTPTMTWCAGKMNLSPNTSAT